MAISSTGVYAISGPIYNLADKVSAVKLADDSPLKDILNGLQPPPPGSFVADNDPSNIYATIQKDGRIVATIYKGGSMMTPNSTSIPPDLANDGTGLSLANTRIRQMLASLGNGATVSYAQKTETQEITAQSPGTQSVNLQQAWVDATTRFLAQLAGQAGR